MAFFFRLVTWIARLLLCAYLPFLTCLLLISNPLGWLGWNRVPDIPMNGPHWLPFFVLALVAHAARLPWSMGKTLAMLVGYGVVTETLQWFVPHRSVELQDYAANLIGVLVGTAAWLLVLLLQRGLVGQPADAPAK